MSKAIVAGLVVGLLAPAMASAAAAGDAVYITSHVDVTPDNTANAIAALKAYVAAARSEPGAARVEAVQEPRANHFDLIEVWRDRAAYDAHQASATTIHFHDVIHPMRGSPFEERVGSLIAP